MVSFLFLINFYLINKVKFISCECYLVCILEVGEKSMNSASGLILRGFIKSCDKVNNYNFGE